MSTTYRCTLIEAGYSDAVIPISSFQMRLRQSPLQCYLSVVVPDILTYADAISDRQTGEIKLTHIADGTSTDLLTANVNAVRYQFGGRRRSGTIVGYKQITFPGTGSTTIAKPTYRALDAGTYRFRSAPAPTLQPTDQAVVTGWETVTAGEIAWSVNNTQAVMEFDGT